MRVLVVGAGAREHALCLSLAADPAVTALICAPGNAGTAAIAEHRPLDVLNPDAVAALAVDARADLVVIGPEAPLVAGAADAVRAAGIACFGPSRQAARLEGSKAFAKEVMAAAGVPTARAAVCDTAEQVEAALAEFGPTVLLVAGTHGDEYEGQVAALRLIQELEPEQLSGRVTIIPVLSTAAATA